MVAVAMFIMFSVSILVVFSGNDQKHTSILADLSVVFQRVVVPLTKKAAKA